MVNQTETETARLRSLGNSSRDETGSSVIHGPFDAARSGSLPPTPAVAYL
jgi:hypothetical protein